MMIKLLKLIGLFFVSSFVAILSAYGVMWLFFYYFEGIVFEPPETLIEEGYFWMGAIYVMIWFFLIMFIKKFNLPGKKVESC